MTNTQRAERTAWMNYMSTELDRLVARADECIHRSIQMNDMDTEGEGEDLMEVAYHLANAIDSIKDGINYLGEAIKTEGADVDIRDYHRVAGQPIYYDGKILCPKCKSNEIEVNDWDDGYDCAQYVSCQCKNCQSYFQIYFNLEYGETILFDDEE
jgi:hypothetical protein